MPADEGLETPERIMNDDQEQARRRPRRPSLPRAARGRRGNRGRGRTREKEPTPSKVERMVRPTFPDLSSFQAASNIGTRNSNFLAGFSVTVLALLLSFSEVVGDTALLLTILFLIFTIAYLLFATESFYRLAQAQSGEEVTFWARWGSGLYGLGTAGLIGAVALMLNSLTRGFGGVFPVLPYVLLAVFSLGWVFYGSARARWAQSGKTPRGGWAVLIESWSILMFLHLGAAFVLTLLLQGGVL